MLAGFHRDRFVIALDAQDRTPATPVSFASSRWPMPMTTRAALKSAPQKARLLFNEQSQRNAKRHRISDECGVAPLPEPTRDCWPSMRG
ncbi:hypothetical protein FJ492_26655 [Mesorhizobium sp. B2-5-4]|uniref:hypothetical protein n=1 Tax=Mesorhizobium sp. B2-5-4 TaxID=2589926 RepID=UPI00112C6605|nr:hypothetical protein [Mesorhizobium sp. B2-5-4]TPK34281.1 hypothetical protein FJ492_26655 [Mesorhizobium sp. B2-5-4]